ncbi:MAG: SDR family NAD(P)-dependent oxidoreductase [Nitrospira sp.]|nr:MAG: SDR family NAD(P)-dependent oxidoreductase [Nitrospira sp.]
MTSASLSGRRIWLTGASSGIGRAVAQELVRRGSLVAASGRNVTALQDLSAKCGPDRLIPVPFDATDRSATTAAARTVQARLGGVDIAFFNAGTCEYVDPRRFDSRLFERVVQTNFMSMVYGIEAVLPLLRESRTPYLVGMSSTVAYGCLPRAEAYGATKAAIKYMLESLRLDLAAEQIPVSVVCPGFVRTPLTDLNDFPMPFRIEVDEAARRIADGMARQDPEIHFPKRFSIPFKLLAMLPAGLYNRVAARLVRAS